MGWPVFIAVFAASVVIGPRAKSPREVLGLALFGMASVMLTDLVAS